MAAGAAHILRFWWVTWFCSLAVAVAATFSMTLDCHLSLNRARYGVAAFETALEHFRAKEGHYPDESSGLDALMPAYVHRVWKDSWGNQYVYRHLDATSRPMVYSKGADGLDALGLEDDVIQGPKEYRCEDYGTNCPPTIFELATMAAGLLFVISTLVGFARTFTWCARKLRKLVV